ncbi:MAG: prolyl oligopeptidase family serine peptidase [Planctomycetota bacterium]
MNPRHFTLPLPMFLLIALICACGVSGAQQTTGERTDFELDGAKAFVWEPSQEFLVDGPMPWVWYAPTFANRLPGPEEHWMIKRFHQSGIAIAGIDVGESYGSPNGTRQYQELYEHLTKKRNYAPKPVLLARSRGGLMLYSWAADNSDKVAAVAGIYPVCNLASYPGISNAAPAYKMTAHELEKDLDKYNPISRMQALAHARVPVFHIHGDQDKIVPIEENSSALAGQLRRMGGAVRIEVIAGQGHNMWEGWFRSERLTAFVINHAHARQVGNESMRGKVVCGYQGWFNCEGDGMALGWKHWARRSNRDFAPGNVTVDMWPDVSELSPEERFKTGFLLSGGKSAEVFSSAHPRTVELHCKWMQQYGIDSIFLQRFANGLNNPKLLAHKNKVLDNVYRSSLSSGRTFALMYDLSGLRKGQVAKVLEDWKQIESKYHLASDLCYQRVGGKPLVALWGIGFGDGRDYGLEECRDLIAGLRNLPSGGCSIMIGVPTYWREGKRDAVDDPLLKQLVKEADLVSPWTVGRYDSPDGAKRHAERVWKADMNSQWLEPGRYLPVVFPGFSWKNLHGGPLNQIPRRGGRFLVSQIAAAKDSGAQMLYVAMSDEVDEGTAIFKVTDSPPVGEGVAFSNLEGLPSDFYLRLVGQAGLLMREEIGIEEFREKFENSKQ